LITLPYEVLVQGYFAESEVTIDWTSDAMKSNPETERLIEEAWSAREAEARKNNQLLFPGTLYRLADWSEAGGTLNIVFGFTDYKDLVGTNLCHPEIAEEYGTEYLSNGTAACSVVITTDHKLVVQQRSDRMYEHPGKYHVCGGNLEPDEGGPKYLSPFSIMKRELWEELGIEPKYIADMHCLGLVKDGHTLKPEMIFETLLRVPADDIARGKGPEHKQLLLINESASELLEFLTRNIDQFVPVGLACLVTYGQRRFGDPWVMAFLARVSNQES